jgi:hypothetical protein
MYDRSQRKLIVVVTAELPLPQEDGYFAGIGALTPAV